ncbi:hypothetical protein MCETHM1_03566 [Flavobacteriaceae bacterium]
MVLINAIVLQIYKKKCSMDNLIGITILERIASLQCDFFALNYRELKLEGIPKKEVCLKGITTI